MKAQPRTHGGVKHIWYHCPGCKHLHGVPAERWNWNGDTENPTLSPSVRHFIPGGEHGPSRTTCHYFIREGRIEYCADCDHALAGQVVDLIDVVDAPEDS